MKKLFFTIILSLFFGSLFSQNANVSFTNLSGIDYLLTFHTESISGTCPTTISTPLHHDVSYGIETVPLKDENGDPVLQSLLPGEITGVTIREHNPPGSTYVVPFCDGSNNHINTGSTTIGTNTIQWNTGVVQIIIY